MQFFDLFTEDRAVSPVIGVILMVAITVILAAVIGTFVLGLGSQVQETSPNAQFNWDESATQLDVTHSGGDSIEPARLKARGNDLNVDCSDGTHWGGTSKVTAGNTCTVVSGTAPSGTYRLVWNSESGEQSSTLTSHDA